MYKKYKETQKFKEKDFSQFFNKTVLAAHVKDYRYSMKNKEIQTGFEITANQMQNGYFPHVKKEKIYDKIVLIQKFFRRFGAVKR